MAIKVLLFWLQGEKPKLRSRVDDVTDHISGHCKPSKQLNHGDCERRLLLARYRVSECGLKGIHHRGLVSEV